MTIGLKIALGLTLPPGAVTDTFAILAQRGAGKSYTGMKLDEQMLHIGVQTIAADPTGVWWGLRSSADGKSAGLPVVIFGGEHADVPLEPTSGSLVADVIVNDGISAVFDLSAMRKAEAKRWMRAFCERLYFLKKQARYKESPLHFFIDEADEFAPQSRQGAMPKGDEAALIGAIEDIIRRGRVAGIGATLMTQRSAVLNKNVLTQVSGLVVLRMPGPQDQAAMWEWVKYHDDTEKAKGMLGTLSGLPTGDAWWRIPTLDIFKRVTVAKRETFDSSATPKVGRKIVQPKVLAPVDIANLRSRLADAIERAAADDPKALRAEIASLRAQIAKLEAAGQKQAEKPLYTPPKVVEVPILPAKAEKPLQQAATALSGAVSTIASLVDKLGTIAHSAGDSAAAIETAIATAAKAADDARQAALSPKVLKTTGSQPYRLETYVDPQHTVILGSQRPAIGRAPARPDERTVTIAKSNPPADGGSLGKGERVTLIAIAQHAQGVERDQLSVLTGYKERTRQAYVQRLRAAGMIDEYDGKMVATPEGIATLGSDYEPLPVGEALRAYWLAKLPEGERRVLEVLVNAYPDTVANSEIDATTGYSERTRQAYIQRLRARRLVERRVMRASDTLFNEPL